MKTFKKVEVMIVAAILGVISLMALPKFSQAGTDERLNTLCSHLQTVRSQLSLYRIHHDDRWPQQAHFVTQMTGRTNVKGTTNPLDGELVFGPYLKSIPVNPITGGNSVNGGDWSYDETTGKFVSADEGQTHGVVHKNL